MGVLPCMALRQRGGKERGHGHVAAPSARPGKAPCPAAQLPVGGGAGIRAAALPGRLLPFSWLATW